MKTVNLFSYRMKEMVYVTFYFTACISFLVDTYNLYCSTFTTLNVIFFKSVVVLYTVCRRFQIRATLYHVSGFLCIPVSSTPSERLFRQAGLLSSHRFSRTTPKTLELRILALRVLYSVCRAASIPGLSNTISCFMFSLHPSQQHTQ